MASDLSSGCTEDIEIFDEEKEEGEISLDDVSSSEESHPNYRPGFRNGGTCANCLSKQCVPWCPAARVNPQMIHRKQDAVHGKENRRHMKDGCGAGGRSVAASTLQEKNDDDLVPISSDSDMEIVGLPGNSKHCNSGAVAKLPKLRKKKKKKRSVTEKGDERSSTSVVNIYALGVNEAMLKSVRGSRTHHRDSTEPLRCALETAISERTTGRSPSRRYRTLRALKSRSPVERSRSRPTKYSPVVDRKVEKKPRPHRSSSSSSPVSPPAPRASREADPVYVDVYATKLLKKVRHLESVGNDFSLEDKKAGSKEHSSLKEKLSNMMKTSDVSAVGEKIANTTRVSGGGAEDDEDIELLRRLALETKQKKSEVKTDEIATENGKHSSGESKNSRVELNLSDDHDSEALELRMIALHSAVMKKHQNRVKQGIRKRRRNSSSIRNESPFGPNEFTDGSEDESAKIPSKSLSDEINSAEDMELDTDVEREKDSMPYSPTDELTSENILVDPYSPNLRPDEASPNRNHGQACLSPENAELKEKTWLETPYRAKTIADRPETHISHDLPGYASSESVANYLLNPEAPYSPSKPLEPPETPDFPAAEKNTPFTEIPYSPTDLPINDPELTRFSPNLSSSVAGTTKEFVDPIRTEHDDGPTENQSIADNQLIWRSDNNDFSGPLEAANSGVDSLIADSSALLMENLTEIDLDGSPLVPVTKESEMMEIPISPGIETDVRETPISTDLHYLRGLPDVTKDKNQIPTVINRNLVPISILKSNKHLQLSLPPKKIDSHPEPTFKSADMRAISPEKIVQPMNFFKPIKLCPITRKDQVLATPASFNADSSSETTLNDTDTQNDNGDSKETEKSKKNQRKARKKVAKPGDPMENTVSSISGQENAQSRDNPTKTTISTSKETPKTNNRKKVTRRSTADSSKEKISGNAKDGSPKDSSSGSKTPKKSPARRKLREKKRGKNLARRETPSDLFSRKSSESSRGSRRKIVDSETNRSEKRENLSTSPRSRQDHASVEKIAENSEKSKETEKNRRCSLEEDEEVLRALLLASLPKRTKNVETNSATVVQPAEPPSETAARDNDPPKPPEIRPEIDRNDFSVARLDSSQSPSPATAAPSIIPTKVDAANHGDLPVESSNAINALSNEAVSRKRPGPAILTKSPAKKIAKKISPVLASTKVVNNAKKYQNAILQKKLNTQRISYVYGATVNSSRNLSFNHLKNSNDIVRASSPKAASKPGHRLVINLESDTDSEVEPDNQSDPIDDDIAAGSREPLAIPTTEFEKSVEQFLKDQRKKMESVATAKAAINPTIAPVPTSNKSPLARNQTLSSGKYSTPLAVRRHLPVSQQEEYRRLKQQILEHERQKLQKTIDTSATGQSVPVNKPAARVPSSLSVVANRTAAQKPSVSRQPEIGISAVPKSDGKNSLVAMAIANQQINAAKTAKNVITVAKTSVNPSAENLSSIGNVCPRVAVPCQKILKGISAPPNPANTSSPLKSGSLTPSITGINSEKFENSHFIGQLEPIETGFSTPFGIPTTDKEFASGIPCNSPSSTSTNKFSLKPGENLTVRIPNGNVYGENMSSNMSEYQGEISDCTNSRNVGGLKILTKAQLNNRFARIQIVNGPKGRRVTVDPTPSSTNPSLSSVATSGSGFLPEQSESNDVSSCLRSSNTSSTHEESCTNFGRKTDDPENSICENSITESNASTIIVPRPVGQDLLDISLNNTISLALGAEENADCLGDLSDRDSSMETAGRIPRRPPRIQKEVWEKLRLDVKNELEVLRKLSTSEQENLLLTTQDSLLKKRNIVLDDLTEMSGYLRQWEFEREIQTKLTAEVRRLREQLKMAEDRLSEQRRQMSEMGPRVAKTHGKINRGRYECFRLSRICQGLGTAVEGPSYKAPNVGARLLNERLKEVAAHTRRLSKKRVPAMSAAANSDARDEVSRSCVAASGIRDEIFSCESSRDSDKTARGSSSSTENYADESGDDSREMQDIGNDSTLELSREHENPEETRRPCAVTDSSEKEARKTGPAAEISNLPEQSEAENPIKAAAAQLENVILCEENLINDPLECQNSIKGGKDLLDENFINSNSKNDTSEIVKSTERSATNENSMEGNEKNGTSEIADGSIDKCANKDLNEDTCISEELETAPDAESDSIIIITDSCEECPVEKTSTFDATESSSLASPSPRSEETSREQGLGQYNSVLAHFKESRNVNPDGILCPYELMGTCNDEDCRYYHLDPERDCQ